MFRKLGFGIWLVEDPSSEEEGAIMFKASKEDDEMGKSDG